MGSFLARTSRAAVALPGSFLQLHTSHAVSFSSTLRNTMPAASQSPTDGNCYSPTVYVHHTPSLLHLSPRTTTRSSLHLSALLSLSYWHRWKAVQYFYHSLLTRSSQTNDIRCRSVLLAIACSRSLINTLCKAAQCLSPIPSPASVAATAEPAMFLQQLVLLVPSARRHQWVQASICWQMPAS